MPGGVYIVVIKSKEFFITFVFIVFLSYISANHVSNLLGIYFSVNTNAIQTVSSDVSSKRIIKYPYEYFSIITNFFSEPEVVEEVVQEENVVQFTPLHSDYELKGIIKIGESMRSVANIFEKKTRKTILLNQNEVLSDGYVLKEFYNDKVLFVRNNENHYLYLNMEEVETSTRQTQTNRVSSSPTSSRESRPSRSTPSRRPNQRSHPVENINHIISKTDLDQQIFANLNDILTSLTIVPNVDSSGKMNGIRIVNLRPDSIIYNFGAREGDVIQRVNGHVIDNMETGFKLWMNVKDEPYIHINLLRNNQPMSISFEVDS